MAESTAAQSQLHYTFYTQPYLFFPRRIHSYLTLKPLPNDIKVDFVPVVFSQDGSMSAPPDSGFIGGTIPMMRYGPSDADFIRQSVAILSYLEEVHPREAKGAESDMRGNDPMEKARVNEIIALVEEASQALGFWCMQSSALYASKVVQNKDASLAAELRMHKCISSFEEYARENVMERGLWVAGTEGCTLADVVLGSLVEYARDMYGRDLGKGHDVVARWVERWEGTEAGRVGGEKVPPEEVRALGWERTDL